MLGVKEHRYNNDMKSNYAIIFHTQSDYEAAFSIIKSLNPDDIDSEEIEMGWESERGRRRAINELRKIGIEVDTYNMYDEMW